MRPLLETLSSYATPVILVLFAFHLLFFLVMWVWYRRDLRAIAATLEAFTRDIRHRSVLEPAHHLSDQIDAFLADINEVLENPSRSDERASLLERMETLDERRKYLQSLRFDTTYNMCRTMVEAYPLAGILGTILAIGAVLQGGSQGDATVTALVARFGESIWATFAGLAAAIVLMFVNSLVETPFTRLSENRHHVRETVLRAKRALSFATRESP